MPASFGYGYHRSLLSCPRLGSSVRHYGAGGRYVVLRCFRSLFQAPRRFSRGRGDTGPVLRDRLDRSYPHHLQVDVDGEFLPSSKPDVTASEYFRRHVKAGRIFVGFDCDDRGLGFAVKEAGNEPFLFATDFPHESFSAESCRREINELLGREDLSPTDKEAILAINAKRFYGIDLLSCRSCVRGKQLSLSRLRRASVH